MALSNKDFLRALIYADIFDYPLTHDELWIWFIGKSSIQKSIFYQYLKTSPMLLMHKGYVTLRQRENIIELRKKREIISTKKLELAKKISKYLSYIPSILFIGVSGGVAMSNADEEDDIDLFIITKTRTLWVSRLFCLFVLSVLGRRRKIGMHNVRDSICLNMFMEEKSLSFYSARHDVYTAHEVLQMIPIFIKGDVYHKFLRENNWIKNILPHAYARALKRKFSMVNTQRENIYLQLFTLPLVLQCAKLLQMIFIKRHRTTETVSDTTLAFHPADARERTLTLYRLGLKKYEVDE